MLLSIEFFAESIIGISSGTFFNTKLLLDNKEFAEISSRDFFDLNCVILKDKKVAASGRNATHSLSNLISGLGTLKIPDSQPVEVKDNSYQKVEIVVETNLFKDPAILQNKLGIKVIMNQSNFPIIPLNNPLIGIKHSNSQTIIDITALFKIFTKKIS